MGGSSGFYVLLALIQKLDFLKWSMSDHGSVVFRN